MTPAEANLCSAQLLIDELTRSDVSLYVLCPGSRSTPLAAALAQQEHAAVVVHYDERGAAFHALGYIRATGRPAAVITTSGTATANLFPAVIEASLDHLPLVVITADRPPEMQNCGANQTINQTRLFGDYARVFVDLGCPEEQEDLILHVARAVQRVDTALHSNSPPGPAHINCPYRKPLVPEPDKIKPLDINAIEVRTFNRQFLGSDQARELVTTLSRAQNGLLVIGRLERERDQLAALELSDRIGWPTVCDPTSGLSLTKASHIVNHFDLILTSERFCEKHPVDTVLHIGGQVVSQRLLDYLKAASPPIYIRNSADSKEFDPDRIVTRQLTYDNVSFCDELTAVWPTGSEVLSTSDWTAASAETASVVAAQTIDPEALTEPSIVRCLSEVGTENRGLFLASSMPIRDFDRFAVPGAGITPIAANRGASGIDGTLASAAGFAAGLVRPVTLLIGDLAFLHDLNSLPLIAKSEQSIVVVVVNNNGGRIFEQLPIADYTGILEKYFVTPHGLSFGQFAQGFGIDYVKVTSCSRFVSNYTQAVGSGRTVVIEAEVDPVRSRDHRQNLIDRTITTINQL